ncbi:MAG TPA: DedA family protein [Anaerolineae bacterium]|nr:DedA family protein [Anaerolineae bacterium]
MDLGEVLNTIKLWVENVISTMGYPGLGLVMFLENIFPPIPSEVVLPLAGSLTLTGRFNLGSVTIVGMFGSLLGAFIFYGLGKWLGEQRVRTILEKYGRFAMLTTGDLDRSLGWFRKFGEYVILFGRMVPIIRSLISIPAGVASMNLTKFTFFTIAGTALWSFLLTLGGRLLGEQWPLIADWISTYQNVVIVLLAVTVIGFLFTRYRHIRAKG